MWERQAHTVSKFVWTFFFGVYTRRSLDTVTTNFSKINTKVYHLYVDTDNFTSHTVKPVIHNTVQRIRACFIEP